MTSPTQRSLKYLRGLGYTAQVVEKFNPFSKTRVDLFGCIDIVAIHSLQIGVLGVQVTSRANISARVKKCKKEPKMKIWLSAGNMLGVHGWGLVGKKGKRKKYEVKIINVRR